MRDKESDRGEKVRVFNDKIIIGDREYSLDKLDSEVTELDYSVTALRRRLENMNVGG